ncbi:HNH endonuclease [Clostridium butyricum]
MILFDKINSKIIVNNISYTIQDSAQANIADSFVDTSNKAGTGSGEARLYVSSQSITPIFNFNHNMQRISKGNKSYVPCDKPCFLSKDNLIKYMEDAELDYFSPNNNYRQDVSLLYQHRLNKIYSLQYDETYFNIYNQNGDFDSARFYIGSVDYAWSFIRELSLPKITYVVIYKLVNDLNPMDILYYFELNHISNRAHPLSYSTHTINNTSIEIQNNIVNDTSISNTEKETIVNSRIGQGKFRTNVLSIMPNCPFTGISEPFLLRASHILPWSDCSTNEDRLNGYNGLTLTPTYDVLFDKGFISFQDNGQLLISPFLPHQIRISLNLIEGQIYNIANFSGQRNVYLDYHRNNIFKR